MVEEKKSEGRFTNAIAVDDCDFLDQSHEVARLWVENNGPANCLIQPDKLVQPEMFGMLMVDAIRHGARAFAQAHEISETEALQRIWSGLEAERDRNTTDLDTVQDFEKPN